MNNKPSSGNCKLMNLQALFFAIMILLIMTCSSKENKSQNAISKPISKAAQAIPKTNKSIRIYDLLADGKPGFTPVAAPEKTGDPLRDAINQFFKLSHWKGDYRQVQLSRIGMINRQAVFYFVGKVNFENEEDRESFRAALDSTLIFHYKSNRFDVQLNGQPW